MGPRYLQGQIHADYSTEESVWSDYRSQIKNRETYVGGVGFKQRSLLDPYDNMDF
jgi:hypothetical protein